MLQKIHLKRAKIFTFITIWLEEQLYDFDGDLRDCLLDWLFGIQDVKIRRYIYMKIQPLFKRNLRNENYIYYDEDEDEGKVPLTYGEFGLLDLESEFFAEQFSFMDMEDFQKINRRDLWQYNPRSSWAQLYIRGERFSQFIASEIVRKKDLNERVRVMTHCIKIALTFLENDNYNGVMWFWEGIQNPAIKRLEKTKSHLPSQAQEIINYFDAKLCGDSKFQLLKTAMQNGLTEKRPVIPWIKLIQTSFDELESSQSDFVFVSERELPLLNIQKMWVLTQQLRFLYNYQLSAKHFLTENKSINREAIRLYIQNLPVLTNETLMNYSHLCE